MSLVLKSTLLTREQMGVENERSIRAAAEARLLEMAEAALGKDKRLIIRDMTPIDLGAASDKWANETSGAGDAWSNTTIADKKIADNRFVAILGMYFGRCYTEPIVTLWKFIVGGSEVARWDLHPLLPRSTDYRRPPIGVTEAPIFIPQNIPLTISEYTWTATTTYHPRVFGLVCEPEGKTIKG
ncbi:hypothetical protein ES703_120483 [subsurface metagenome]